MTAETQVLFWWIAFAGSHTALSHPPVRSALARRIGERPFLGLYSLVAFATFVPLVWTFFANRLSRGTPLPALAAVPGVHWLTMALMLFAIVLLVLGFSRPNPISPLTGKADAAVGALRVTRHPVFMAFAVFGLAHLLVNHSALDRIFFGGVLVYSLIGAAHQDWRKRRMGNDRLRSFFAETSFLPFAAIAGGRNRLVLRELSPAVLGVAAGLFVLVFLLHHRLFA